MRKDWVKWFTTVVDGEDLDILEKGFHQAVHGKYKEDILEEVFRDVRFWQKYAGLTQKQSNIINSQMKLAIIKGEWRDKNKVLDRLMSNTGISRKKAELIAKTELANFANLVREKTYEKDTRVSVFTWMTEEDSEVCKNCKQMRKDARRGVSLERLKELVGKNSKKGFKKGWQLHGECYIDGTEVFTEYGWKDFKDVEIGERCWSLNPKTREMELVKVVANIGYEVDDDVVSFKNKWSEVVVTKNHMMWGKHKKYEPQLRPKPADSLLRSDFIIPKVVEWKGAEGNMDYVKFMAWYLSEGSVSRNCVKISQNNNENRKEISDLCNRLFDKVWTGKNAVYVPNEKDLVEFLKGLGKSNEKYIPQEIKNLDSKYLREFIITYAKGDGSIEERGKYDSESISLYTSSEKMMNDLCEVILKAGWGFSVRKTECAGKKQRFDNGIYTINNDLYNVSVTKSKDIWLHNMEVKLIPYHGMVRDVELERNHILLVKYNGKIMWSGNCRCSMVRHYKGDRQEWEKGRPTLFRILKGIRYIKPDEVAHYEALGYTVEVGARGGRKINTEERIGSKEGSEQERGKQPSGNVSDFMDDETADELIEDMNNDVEGGFTFTGNYEPFDIFNEDVWLVGITSDNFPANKKVTKEDIVNFRNKYKELYNEFPELKVGGFHSEQGYKSIDLVLAIEDKDRAVELGQKFNQESIFNGKRDETVNTGGNSEPIVSTPDEVKNVVSDILGEGEKKEKPKMFKILWQRFK